MRHVLIRSGMSPCQLPFARARRLAKDGAINRTPGTRELTTMMRSPDMQRVQRMLGVVAGMLVMCAAQAASVPGYNPLETFAPYQFQYPVNRYRSANGLPGPDYWQNRANYQIVHGWIQSGGRWPPAKS